MSDAFIDTIKISASGMKAESDRSRIAARNLANAATTDAGDGKPYQREIPVFQQVLDRENNQKQVNLKKIVKDESAFEKRYEPSHPKADQNGYVEYPNVNPIIEKADYEEAKHNYQAGLKMIKATQEMHSQTVNLLKP